MTDDIVTRLGEIEGGYGFRAICREARAEIERLREMLRLEREECAACAIDRRETQWERDEARRMYCEQMSIVSRQQACTRKWFADEMGWDCFKEEP